MTTTRLADGDRVEVSRLQEDVLGVFGHTAFESAKDTGNTHCLFFVGNHQIAAVHLTLYAIEGNEFLSLASIANMDLVALDLVCIEGVKRLSALMEHEVRDIDDVVNRTQTDSEQAVLEPIRRFFDLHTFDIDTRITRSSIGRVHMDAYWSLVVGR